MEIINLFEFQNKEKYDDSLNGLEDFLDEIWKKRSRNPYYRENISDEPDNQHFLHFLRKTGELKSGKYVGVIHFQGFKINLLPKLFYAPGKTYSNAEISNIQSHILWWLSYCRKIRFPNYSATLGKMKSDFFEVLIFLFSKYTKELLSSVIYQQYTELNRESFSIKGRLNTTNYIRENISTGNWHKFNCTYDAFEIDNKFNRIIKYVSILLHNETGNEENRKNLREILFILDEIENEKATAEQCLKFSFNPMMEKFETVRDYCYLFLSNSVSFEYKNDLKLFAFLIPMEYVFEDFIYGFIEKEVQSLNVKSQVSSVFLDQERHFGLKPDLFITGEKNSIIADTKYKIVYSLESNPKNGISQNDLYQMLVYAIRFNIDVVFLFYPETLNEKKDTETEIVILDELAEGKRIRIKACQVPIIHKGLMNEEIQHVKIQEIFEPVRSNLKIRLEEILLPLLT